MVRAISLFIRTLQGKKEIARNLRQFTEWKSELEQLPPPTSQNNVLIVRLDDIGDYLLFRNMLEVYQGSSQFAGYVITLLGNIAWKPLFEAFDATHVSNTIWVNKNKYFDDHEYRVGIWKNIRAAGYSVVICPARSRSLLLDDCCMLAAGAPTNISGKNTLIYPALNAISDGLYKEQYSNKDLSSEFFYNQDFANWSCIANSALPRPTLPLKAGTGNKMIIGFVGGSKKSHIWPSEKWIELVQEIKATYQHAVKIAGGSSDTVFAEIISKATGAENIAGKVNLLELTQTFTQAALVITHDTMAAHLAVSLGIPTLIIANGDNFYRFSGYKEAGIESVDTVYPPLFLKAWHKHNCQPFNGYKAVTNDIQQIAVEKVVEKVKHFLK